MGQVRGAFVMGLGLWLSEELLHEPRTGALTNHRAWVRKRKMRDDAQGFWNFGSWRGFRIGINVKVNIVLYMEIKNIYWRKI